MNIINLNKEKWVDGVIQQISKNVLNYQKNIQKNIIIGIIQIIIP